jgi:hypothetical protein
MPTPFATAPVAQDAALDVLATSGIVSFGPLFDVTTVASWNERLAPLFASLSAERATLGADVLARTGVLQECLTPAIRTVVALSAPDARIYHAHAYEIEGGQERSHIHAGRLHGWHRDTETIRAYDRARPVHLSLFVYLTDVGVESGPFEFVPQSPTAPVSGRLPAHSVTGPAGTAFVWNRSHYHRAAPNRSRVRRRVLTLSWQPAALPNTRIDRPEFAAAASMTADDPWLAALLGGPAGTSGGSAAPPAEAAPPAVVPLPYGTEVAFGRADRIGERVRLLRHRLLP